LYPVGNLFIPAPHGKLEAILKEPRPPADSGGGDGGGSGSVVARGVALVLHPHPLHGGTMHNKVVFRAARALNDAGCVTLRFNFRGVGQTTGTHDYARGEQDDARLALDYLAEHYPDVPLMLAGFSFGARVGLELGIRDERVRALIGIGTPVSIPERGYDFSFLGECRKPVLFVHGDRDEFGDVGKLQMLAAQMHAGAHARVAVVAGAGHFFDEHLDEVSRVIREWTERVLEELKTGA